MSHIPMPAHADRRSVSFDPAAPPPALFLAADEWASLADRLEDPFFAALHRRNLALLDAYLRGETDLRRRSGGLLSVRVVKNLVQRGAVAWHITGRPRYADLAVETLLDACRRSWEPIADHRVRGIRYADLGTGEMMYIVSFGLEALHDRLPLEQRRACVRALLENGMARYFAGVDGQDWWVRCDFNWNSALHGNAGIAALAVRAHAPEPARRALETARNGLRCMTDAYLQGGGWTEGLMYFGTATGHLTDFARAHERALGNDLGVLTNRNLHESIDFALDMHGADGRAYNFSNCPARPGGWVRPFVFWYADRLRRPDWAADQQRKIEAGALDDLRSLFTDIDCFWYRRPFQPTIAPPVQHGVRHFEGIDWLRWRGPRSWLAFRSGYSGGNHNNSDLGQFIFGLDGTRYLADPGKGNPQTRDHNCPTVRHKDQTEGATARITNLNECAHGIRLTCDISQAFPFMLSRYERHLVLWDDAHLLVVDDLIGRTGVPGRADIRTDVEGHLQSEWPARTTPEGFAIDGPEGTLRVILGCDVSEKRIETYRNGRETFHRMSWCDAYYRVHTVQPILFTTSDAAVEQEIGEDVVQVRVGESAMRIRLGHESF